MATKQKTDAQTVADHASQRQSQQQSNPFLKQPVNPEDVRTNNYNHNCNNNIIQLYMYIYIHNVD